MYWAHGPKPTGNVGDWIGPFLYTKDVGVAPEATTQRSPDLLTCGSIIRFARPGTVVWGSGSMRHSDEVCATARYHAVRGPLTYEMVVQAGAAAPYLMCDPGMCLPYVCDPQVDQTEQPGFVPHYMDLDAGARFCKANGWKLVSPLRRDVESFVKDICSCAFIASSSLHGLVVALAYDVNAVWVPLSDKVNGNGFKFRDFGASIGWRAEPCPAEPMAIEQFAHDYGLPSMRPVDRVNLVHQMWEARPWKA